MWFLVMWVLIIIGGGMRFACRILLSMDVIHPRA
jgi:hypothetical protein